MSYDGAIRILTQISTDSARKSLGTLSKMILGTAKEIASLRSKMDALKGQKIDTAEYQKLKDNLASAEKEMEKMGKESSKLSGIEEKIKKLSQSSSEYEKKMKEVAGQKIPTQDYREVSNHIQKARAELNRLIDKQSEMQLEGKDSGVAWDRIGRKIEETSKEIRYAKSDLQDLAETGNAFTLGTDTEQYRTLSEKHEQINQELANQKALHDEITQKQTESVQKVEELKAQMRGLEEAGKAFTLGENTAEYANLQQNVQSLEQARAEVMKLQELAQRTGDPYARLGQSASDLANKLNAVLHPVQSVKSSFANLRETAKANMAGIAGSIMNGIAHPIQSIKAYASSAGKSVSGSFSGMATAIKKAGSALISLIAKLPLIGKFAKQSSGGIQSMGLSFRQMLRYGIGVESLFTLINKIRRGIAEGMGNLAQYSAPVNTAISGLVSSLATLKNSLATAFAPILTVVAPTLTTFINMLATAATYVGMFFAALTGKSSFTKAVGVQKDFAAGLDKTAAGAKKAEKALKGYLSPLDEIHKMEKQDASGGGGGGGGGASAGDMFEEVPIDGGAGNFAEMIKQAWQNADFTAVGEIIGSKLKDALESIPWEGIRETAGKIGKSLATFINGGIEVDGLGRTIGNTIAQAINTALDWLNGFVQNLHFGSVGKLIGDGINGVLGGIDWKTAFSAVGRLGSGIAEAVNNAVATADFGLIGETLANAINLIADYVLSSGGGLDFEVIGEKISESINSFFDKLKPADLAKAISTWIKGALKALVSLFKKTDFEKIGDKIAEFLINLDMGGIISGLASALWEAIKGAFTALLSIFRSAPLEASIVAAIALIKFNSAAQTFASNFAGALKSQISAVMPGVVAGFAEFGTIVGSFKNLTTGAGNFITEIGKIGGAAVAAGTVMTSVFGFPFGVIASGIVGILGAIGGMVSGMDEMEQKAKEEEEISKYGQTLSSMATEIERSTQAIKERAAASEEYVKTAGVGEANMAKNMADRYFELAEKENRSNAETAEMQRLAKLLVQSYPELETYYNNQTGLLNTTRQSVENVIEARLREIQINALEEQLTQAYREQAAAAVELEKAMVPANDTRTKMNELQKERDGLAVQQEWLDLYNQLDGEIATTAGSTDELKQKQKELEELLTNGGEREIPSMKSLQDAMSDVTRDLYNFQDKYDGIMAEMATAEEGKRIAEESISTLTKLYSEGFEGAAEAGIAGYNNTMGNDTSMGKTSKAAAEDILGKFSRDGLFINSPSKKFMEAGRYSILGYNKGITDSQNSTISLMQALARGIIDAFKDLKMNFTNLGRDAVGGIKAGFDEGGLSDFLSGKTSTIVNAFSGIPSQLQPVGGNIVTIIANGIKNSWSTLTRLAQDIKDLFTISIKTQSSSKGGISGKVTASSAYSRMMSMPVPEIPHLARGTVIPPNREFLAVLGDQKHGTNIEAPLDTIKQGVAEVLAELGAVGGSGQQTIIIKQYLDGKQVAQSVVKEGKLQQMSSGRNMFMLGTT